MMNYHYYTLIDSDKYLHLGCFSYNITPTVPSSLLQMTERDNGLLLHKLVVDFILPASTESYRHRFSKKKMNEITSKNLTRYLFVKTVKRELTTSLD